MKQQMPEKIGFNGCSLVSCGILRPELESLKKEGFFNTDKILYTKPGLHEVPRELEKQLKNQISHEEGRRSWMLRFPKLQLRIL